MHNLTKTTFLTLAGSALLSATLVGVASAQPWQDQNYQGPGQATTTRTVTTYTHTDVPPPPPPPEDVRTTRTVTTYTTDHDVPPPPPPGQLGPRVSQIDQRIGQLNWRVGHLVHHGALSPRQGDWFHQQILNVQGQEQAYTTRGYGHLNDGQQRQLNLKLDRISHRLDRYAY